MSKRKFRLVLTKYVPGAALSEAVELWERLPFHFTVSRQRNSKYGDYRYDPRTKTHSISVNGDLNPYAFLITYVHEFAHLVTYEQHGRKVSPHGLEWKKIFQKEMAPFIRRDIFPEKVLAALARHMRNPKASSASDPNLVRALRGEDEGKSHLQTLIELNDGDTFRFQKKFFTREELRRTRFLCNEVGTGRKYLISKVALVEVVRQ